MGWILGACAMSVEGVWDESGDCGMGCENGKRAEEHGVAVSKSQVGYLCVIHVMIMQGAGIWVWEKLLSRERMCSV